MQNNSRYALWLIVASLIFLGLVAVYSEIVMNLITESKNWRGFGIWLISDGISVFIISILVLVLATFRITRLVVYDKMVLPVRQSIAASAKKGNGFGAVLHDLVSCPWCLSVWAALAILFLLLLGVFGFVLIGILALSGAASFLQILSNLVGWSAERKKRKVLGE